MSEAHSASSAIIVNDRSDIPSLRNRSFITIVCLLNALAAIIKDWLWDARDLTGYGSAATLTFRSMGAFCHEAITVCTQLPAMLGNSEKNHTATTIIATSSMTTMTCEEKKMQQTVHKFNLLGICAGDIWPSAFFTCTQTLLILYSTINKTRIKNGIGINNPFNSIPLYCLPLNNQFAKKHV